MEFRLKALQKMREPDELDTPTLLAAPRGWVAVFVVLIVMAGAVTWGFLGRLPLTVSATGLLTHPLGVAAVESPYAGVVSTVAVSPGEHVAAGQRLALVSGATGEVREVTSPFPGMVVSVSVNGGQVVMVGTQVVSVERSDGADDRQVAMLFFPADRATGITVGQSVELAVSSAPPQAFGLLRGTVTSVSPYPLPAQALTGLLGDALAIATYAPHGAPRLVVVDLIPDAGTRSGYAWTTTKGPPMPLLSQEKVTGTIALGGRSPVSFVLGR